MFLGRTCYGEVSWPQGQVEMEFGWKCWDCEKDAGILSGLLDGLLYGARSRNLWERQNFPPQQSREIFCPISFNWHNTRWITFCLKDLLRFLAASQMELYQTSNFWSFDPSFKISHHCQIWSVISEHINLFSHIFGLIIAFPMDQHLHRGMRIM